MLGAPSTITLMCPSLDRGMCNMLSLSRVKAYAQSLPVIISSPSLCTASAREEWGFGEGVPTLLPDQMPSPL